METFERQGYALLCRKLGYFPVSKKSSVIIKTDEDMDLGRLLKLWRGEDDDAAATAGVIGTAAIALRLMGRTDGIEDAEAQAQSLWENRAESLLDVEDKALEDDIPEPV